MSKRKTSTALSLLASVAFLGSAGCHSAASHPPAASSIAPALSNASLKEIHVDQRCHVLQDPANGVKGSGGTDSVVCHLESVHLSHHIEEATNNGSVSRSRITISEQEYLLQNVTAEPVTFVVQHLVPTGWRIDSDPTPTEIVGTKALFRVSAEPGQIVRLHVGERHEDPITVNP